MATRFAGWMPLALLALVLGCAGPEESPAWLVRDSADVRVVENLQPAWGPEVAWRVAAEPTVEIGAEEGEDPYIFFRVFDALRLNDGRIIVSNAGSGEIRFFDPQGGFLYSVGRQGQGPGEFGEFSSMRIWASRAGLVVTDDGNARVNLFRPSGEFINSYRIEPLPGWSVPGLIGGFGDGSSLAVTGSILFSRGPTGPLEPDTLRYFRYNADGTPGDQLVSFPGRPRYRHTARENTHYPFVPLHVEASVTADAFWLFAGGGAAAEVERRRLDGTLNSIIRWSDRERRRSDEVYDRYKAESLETMSERTRQAYTPFLELDLPVPEYLPVFQGLLVDDEGYLWVERYRLPWETSRWEIFDPDGRWLGAVETPEGVLPFQIGRDFLLGRHRDDMGIERIRLYSLIKPDRL